MPTNLKTASSSSATPAQAPKEIVAAAPLKEFSSMKISDRSGQSQTLYFGVSSNPAFSVDTYELPPLPPEGSFDARFVSGSMVATGSGPKQSYLVHVQASSFPLTLHWKLHDGGKIGLTIRDAESGALLFTSSDGQTGTVRISNSGISLIRVEIGAAPLLPKEFALKQNYPNPFNPTTTIVFDLPTQAKLSLKVFNILGQEVAVLAQGEEFTAGTHSVVLHAEDLSSGIYFYQLSARGASGNEFHQVKKMMLLK